LNFLQKFIPDFRITTPYEYKSIISVIYPFTPIVKENDYVMYSLPYQLRLLLSCEQYAKEMRYNADIRPVVTESFHTRNFARLCDEGKNLNCQTIVLSLFRDDFREYFLGAKGAGDCSFIVENLPIRLARRCVILFCLNSDNVNFQKTLAPPHC